MKRSTVLSFAVVAAALAVPGTALAKPIHATVLNLDRHHHKTRLILPGHNVKSFHVAGRIGRKVKVGSHVSADARGKTLRHVRVDGRAKVLKFYGRVVSSGTHGLVLRLGDGKKIKLGGKSHRFGKAAADAGGSPSISITIDGLQPGQTVLVTVTLGSAGAESISIQIMASQASAGDGSSDNSGDLVDDGDDGTIDDNNGDDYTVDGTVTAVDPQSGTLEIDTFDGHLAFTADADVLDGISVGDAVEVDFAKDTSTGELLADDVFPVDSAGDGTDPGTSDQTGDGSGDQTGSGDETGSGDQTGTGDGSGDLFGPGLNDQPPAAVR